MKKNLKKQFSFVLYLLIVLLLSTCKKETIKKATKQDSLFTLLDNQQTNIHFKNKVTETVYFNFLTYPYVYNGGGVGVGDINNDGLEDVYFTSNQQSNKLYLNQGDFQFKDITNTAKVKDDKGWSTGVTFTDINNDGWLDIYVCKSGALESHELRKNKLFINQKDNTFIEKAKEYGLDHYGFSIQSYFFDIDNDGDLDMYLVNHRQDFRNNVTIDLERDKKIEDYGSDQLFRNDNGTFINITNQAGIANKAWGLSASIGDFNNDGWLDVFVANDFFHPDYLYINNQNGTFSDKALTTFKHISNNSMGSDFADINNDLLADLVVLDMVAEDHIRGKKNMASMNTKSFNSMVKAGYHHQYMSNMLQLNNGDGTYSEIAQLSGIHKTDWSWAPLIADFDNDGLKDLFVTNGIKKELSNQDFRDQMRQNILNRKKVTIEQAIAMMPSEKLQNYLFKNNGDLSFQKVSSPWGINQKINSNGSVYVDLDNDGDLDLITNNQSDEASIYKNNSINNYITFSLKGNPSNIGGIGAKIHLYAKNLQQSKQHFVSRGYQSSITNKIHFGLGNIQNIDSVKIIWDTEKQQIIKQPKINSTTILEYKNAYERQNKSHIKEGLFTKINSQKLGVDFVQKEKEFNDFELQVLLPHKQSEITKALCIGDVNKDGLDDFFVGNASDERASLYIQNNNGKFIETNSNLFKKDAMYEDTDAQFLDVDGDGDLDLYVASGSYEFTENNSLLKDRLYLNNGNGQFMKSKNLLPKIYGNTRKIVVGDFDKDKDMDIFICGGTKHGKYPMADKSYLLENNNGKYIDGNHKIKGIENLQIINDGIFTDYDNDGDVDLMLVGEWMPIQIFENINNKFINKEIKEFKNTNGWYQSITKFDFNNDGFNDYIIGNWGTNNKFHPSKEKPLHIYADYLDDNDSFDMVLSKTTKTGKLLPVRGKECSTQQTPFLKKKITTYKDFALSTLPEIYGEKELENAIHLKVSTFKSVIALGNGKGQFRVKNLPNPAQFGPLLNVVTHDFNNDGKLDIFGVGDAYDSEVETIRYDALKGVVLLNKNTDFKLLLDDNSYFTNNEAKAIKKIIIQNKTYFIILNKNSELTFLKLIDK